ncbi:MAG: hypothetical protein ACX930_05805 [Erythrobacter sp.]
MIRRVGKSAGPEGCDVVRGVGVGDGAGLVVVRVGGGADVVAERGGVAGSAGLGVGVALAAGDGVGAGVVAAGVGVGVGCRITRGAIGTPARSSTGPCGAEVGVGVGVGSEKPPGEPWARAGVLTARASALASISDRAGVDIVKGDLCARILRYCETGSVRVGLDTVPAD